MRDLRKALIASFIRAIIELRRPVASISTWRTWLSKACTLILLDAPTLRKKFIHHWVVGETASMSAGKVECRLQLQLATTDEVLPKSMSRFEITLEAQEHRITIADSVRRGAQLALERMLAMP